ncbi:hypothetical protein MMC25_002375 [Agyrium rufum]|nr:hypothetical protein [Agyrium rufum]
MAQQQIQTNSSAVPKFSGFRRRPPISEDSKELQPQVNPESESKSTGQSLKEDPDLHRRKRHHHHHHHHDRKSELKLAEHRKEGFRRPSKVRHETNHVSLDALEVTPWDEAPNTFVADSKGDPANLSYGTLHKYDIPSYHRDGSGSVVGLPSKRRINRNLSNEKSIVLTRSSDDPTVRDRSILSKASKLGLDAAPILVSSSCSPSSSPPPDYIAISTSDVDAVGSSSDSEDTDDDVTDQHRFMIEKRRQTHKPNVAQKDPTSKRETSPSTQAIDRMRLTNTQLSRNTIEDPTSGKHWLELIYHQDRLLEAISSHRRNRITMAERLSTAEIKLSMCEKALRVVANEDDQERLLILMMEQGFELWEAPRLAAKWKEILSKYRGRSKLWLRYLDYQQTQPSSMRYEHVKRGFIDCLQLLDHDPLQLAKVDGRPSHHLELQIYIFLRTTLFIRESGFLELAVAAWQAMFELTFCRPSQFRSDSKLDPQRWTTVLRSFEEFWESEVPRIGESGSQGWSSFVSSDISIHDRPAAMSEDDSGVSDTCWIADEWNKALQARQPARTEDGLEDDDPYRAVLFSDIKPLLFDFHPKLVDYMFVDAWLAFCHLPPLHSEAAIETPLNRDPFVANEGLFSRRMWANWAPSGTKSSVIDGGSLVSVEPFHSPVHSFRTTLDTLFPGAWYSSFKAWKTEYADDDGPLRIDWIHQILTSLVNRKICGSALAEFQLAFEGHVCPKNVKKTAKSLLKAEPTNIRIYNAYALADAMADNVTGAIATCMRALKSSSNLGEASSKYAILLWRSFVWFLLETNERDRAKSVIIHGPLFESNPQTKDSVRDSNIQGLRCQRELINATEQDLSLNDFELASAHAELITLLAYLTATSSLEGALQSFFATTKRFTARLPQTKLTLEIMHQAFARLLYFHVKNTPYYQPTLVRSAINESIKLFPQNTMFLSLYSWHESRFRMQDRVRSIMSETVFSSQLATSSSRNNDEPQESVISHFFAMYTELHRSQSLGSSDHAVRAAFERAFDTRCGKRCAALWKLYFLFECRQAQSIEKAKGVLYRSIMACPWAKDLYLLAFEYLDNGGMTKAELRALYAMMEERELRIHMPYPE